MKCKRKWLKIYVDIFIGTTRGYGSWQVGGGKRLCRSRTWCPLQVRISLSSIMKITMMSEILMKITMIMMTIMCSSSENLIISVNHDDDKIAMMMVKVWFLTLLAAFNGLMKNSAAGNCVFLSSFCNWVNIAKKKYDDYNVNDWCPWAWCTLWFWGLALVCILMIWSLWSISLPLSSH